MRPVIKPWGYEEIWAENEKYLGKMLSINDGHKLSRQYHRVKDETIRVQHGILTLELGMPEDEDFKSMKLPVGASYRIKPGTVHRFCAENGRVILLEASTGEVHDVVRLEDDYDR